MEIVTTGKAIVSVRIENLRDVYLADEGALPEEEIRAIDVTEALVDTTATLLSMPRMLVGKLGLNRTGTRTLRTSAGTFQFGIYDAVRLALQGRDCIVEVAQVPDDCPVLIGKVPLGLLDFVVDSTGQKLMGNPEHGGKHIIDMFLVEN